MVFLNELENFLRENGIPSSLVRGVPLGEEARRDSSAIFIFEDRWHRDGENIRKRLSAHNGQFRSIFARKCKVKSLSTLEANQFLNLYHSYGGAKSKYRYGLFSGEQLVAVATFSGFKVVERECPVESYEWVRYTSLPDVRVVGGMGKLLGAFVKEVNPQEVMSYADLEWSDGDVYRKLGFQEAELREPVEFYIDTTTWERISVKKIHHDRAYKRRAFDDSALVRIKNCGSLKYLKRYWW